MPSALSIAGVSGAARLLWQVCSLKLITANGLRYAEIEEKMAEALWLMLRIGMYIMSLIGI